MERYTTELGQPETEGTGEKKLVISVERYSKRRKKIKSSKKHSRYFFLGPTSKYFSRKIFHKLTHLNKENTNSEIPFWKLGDLIKIRDIGEFKVEIVRLVQVQFHIKLITLPKYSYICN